MAMGEQVEQRVPTTERLTEALREAGAPAEMVERALSGVYDDYHENGDVMNIHLLVADSRAAGLDIIADRAVAGEFDAQGWESDEWAKSPDGQSVLAQFPHLRTR